MKKIKLLFKGKVKYNSLLLGILSITTVIRLALFPQNNVWIMNIPAAILIKLFTKTTMHIQDLVFKSATLAISHSVFAVMLLLFILSCVIYIKKKPKAYFVLNTVQFVVWGLMIGTANFSAVQFFANITGAVAICSPILGLVVFFIVNTVRVKKAMEEEKEKDDTDGNE